jgi:hypothetical protein
MDQSEFLIKARKWQKLNPEWELICDMKETDSLYIQFGELPVKERMHWIGTYREEAVKAFNEFATKQCKVERLFLNEQMELVSVWPEGQAMTCFKTNKKG